MADTETKPAAASSSEAPSSPSSSDKSGGSSNKGDNRFYSLFQSIQKNIETLNYVTKEVEKINDRILFHSSAMTPAEESTLINKVAHIHKDTAMKARESSRLIKNLRLETTKPAPAAGGETKKENEKSEEEKAEDSRDVGDKENICKTVTRSFTDELLLYQSAIQDFKNELKERLTKRVQTIRPKASEDFIDLSLRSESSRYALFREIMAADEKDLSEEDAKVFKDEIAEKYVIIAELSLGASEMNKIFLNLASSSSSAADPNSKSLSDSSDEEDPTPRASTRGSRNPYAAGSSSRRGSGLVDDLLGSLRPNPKMKTRGTPAKEPMDANKGASSGTSQGKRRHRLFAFMKHHRNASVASAKEMRADMSGVKVSKRRGGRASRWMALFFLATVALAAITGIVMIH